MTYSTISEQLNIVLCACVCVYCAVAVYQFKSIHMPHRASHTLVHSSNTQTHRLHTAAMIWSSPKWEQVCLSVAFKVNEWESRPTKLLRRQCNCWGGLNHPVSCEQKALLSCSHTRTPLTQSQNIKSKLQIITGKPSFQSKEEKLSWCLLYNIQNKTVQQLFCIVLLFIVISFTRFIYNTACIILQGCLWGPGCVFILVSIINHFPGRLSGAGGEGGERRGGVPAVPPLWPLMAPSNERRHSHTDALALCWSPFFPFLLPVSFYSPLFLPSVNSVGAQGTIFVSSSSFPSPAPFVCFEIPPLHSPTAPSLLLSSTQHALQKTTIKHTFLLVSLKSGNAKWS